MNRHFPDPIVDIVLHSRSPRSSQTCCSQWVAAAVRAAQRFSGAEERLGAQQGCGCLNSGSQSQQ